MDLVSFNDAAFDEELRALYVASLNEGKPLSDDPIARICAALGLTFLPPRVDAVGDTADGQEREI